MKRGILRAVTVASLLLMSMTGAASAVTVEEPAQIGESGISELPIPSTDSVHELADESLDPYNICIEVSLSPPGIKIYKC